MDHCHTQRVITVLAYLLFILLSLEASLGSDLPEKCSLAPVNGSCKAMIEKYYFDQGTRKCKEYYYDGCGPVVPFDDMEGCRALCETGEEPRLAKVSRIEGKPFATVTVEYPKSWKEEPKFNILADGTAVEAKEIGGGFDQQVKMVDFLLLRDAPAKAITVEVLHQGAVQRLTTPFFWAPFTATLLNHVGKKEALFAPTGLDFLTIGTSDFSIVHNGKTLPAQALKTARKGVLHVDPAWKRGLNLIVIKGKTSTGAEFSSDYSFMYFPEKHLKVGEKGRLICGPSGSRSGPFYSVKASSEALYISEHSPQAEVLQLEKDGWPFWQTYETAEFTGITPGTATVEITQKWFLMQKKDVVEKHQLQVDAGKKTTSGLLHDPVEDDPAYAEVFKVIDSEVDQALAHHPMRGSMGFCHTIWETKKGILKRKYGIEWETPAEMNPQVIFD